jgi:hypothetical protein
MWAVARGVHESARQKRRFCEIKNISRSGHARTLTAFARKDNSQEPQKRPLEKNSSLNLFLSLRQGNPAKSRNRYKRIFILWGVKL